MGRPDALPPGVRPEAITDHQRSRQLDIVWSDGLTSRLPHTLLRVSCRCAACEQQRSSGQALLVAPDVQLCELRPVGELGLNLVFSDGHGRGIFPWVQLRSLGCSLAEV